MYNKLRSSPTPKQRQSNFFDFDQVFIKMQQYLSKRKLYAENSWKYTLFRTERVGSK
jgi:hypothetical protein